MSLIGLTMLTFGVFVVSVLEFPWNYPFPENLLLARTSTISGYAGNHTLIFVMLLFGVWVFLFKKGRGKQQLYGKDKFFKNLLTFGLIPALHESLWIVTYVLKFGWTNAIITSWHYGKDLQSEWIQSAWFATSIIILVVYILIFRWGKFETAFLLSFIPMYAFWFAIGFPVTLRFEGATNLYYEPLTNLIEILSWLYAIVMFFLLSSRLGRSKSKEVTEERGIENIHGRAYDNRPG